ncbi:MAG TPA: UTP--glucose-1-phosphate uridylyltransferase [Polyangiaceae bacterium]
MTTLSEELAALPPTLTAELGRYRFDPDRLLELALRLSDEASSDNRVKGAIAPPSAEDVVDLPSPESEEGKKARERGLELLREGGAALVVLAGGMATRMGGVVKALVPALPGRTFLDLRLAERRSLEAQVGRDVPLWLMTSAATDAAVRSALGSELDGYRTAVFPQRLSLRLTKDGKLFRDEAGNPSHHAPGHGDLVDSLKDSGLLAKFIARGGKVVSMANLDNLGATLDPAVLGVHVKHGRPVTCEVVDKLESDRGGIPVRHGGRTVVLEEFRIPETFDPAQVRVFNTNTFHFDARALLEHDGPWTYFVVNKKVGGNVAIQFERLINEVTSHLGTVYLRVPRSGAESRFLPVKDNEELAARKGEIEAVAKARGMLE